MSRAFPHTRANDFARGRNAIAELCKKVTDIQALTNIDVGTTVCVDVIHGGTNFGAFPAHAEATFDDESHFCGGNAED